MTSPGLAALRQGLVAAGTREDAIEAVTVFLRELGLTEEELVPLSAAQRIHTKAGRPPRLAEHNFLIALEAQRILESSPDTGLGRAIKIASGMVACHHGFPIGMRVPKGVDPQRDGVDVLSKDVDLDAVVTRVSLTMKVRRAEIQDALRGSIFIQGSRRTKPGRGRPRKSI